MRITELAEKLEHFGLREKEAKVYLASLFLGPSSVQKIAQEAGINRATTYVVLDSLAENGLISQSHEGKKTVFVAEEPQAIEKLLERQQRQIADNHRALRELLPRLDEISRVAKPGAPVVRFYKGVEGIFNSFDHALRHSPAKSTILGISNYDAAQKYYAGRVFKEKPKRLKKKISYKLLYSSASESYPSDKKKLRETIRLETPFKADITIYDRHVCFVTYDENEPIATMIDNADIAGVMAQLFELIWQDRQA